MPVGGRKRGDRFFGIEVVGRFKGGCLGREDFSRGGCWGLGFWCGFWEGLVWGFDSIVEIECSLEGGELSRRGLVAGAFFLSTRDLGRILPTDFLFMK